MRTELGKYINFKNDEDNEDIQETVQRTNSKGQIENRFESGHNVVLNAPSNVKQHSELHLPAMVDLTCKGSSQHYLLRLLKIILELRQTVIDKRKEKKESEKKRLENADGI